MCSGILVSFRLEQSTTLDSQRHLGGHTGSLLQALFRRVSSVPERDTMRIVFEGNAVSLSHDALGFGAVSPLPCKGACLQRVSPRPERHSSCLNSTLSCPPATFLLQRREMNGQGSKDGRVEEGGGVDVCYYFFFFER